MELHILNDIFNNSETSPFERFISYIFKDEEKNVLGYLYPILVSELPLDFSNIHKTPGSEHLLRVGGNHNDSQIISGLRQTNMASFQVTWCSS